MLENYRKGYAVMNKDLTGYSIEDENIETCKRYCRNGDVIVEQIPYVSGFSLTFIWYEWYKMLEFNSRYERANIFKLHFRWKYEYLHRIGEIVFRSK